MEQSQVGTPLFAAPEVLAGDYYDQSCDIYSFGVLLLNMSVDVKILQYFGKEYEHHINGKKKNWMDVINALIKGFRPRVMPHTPKTLQHLTTVSHCAVQHAPGPPRTHRSTTALYQGLHVEESQGEAALQRHYPLLGAPIEPGGQPGRVPAV